MLRPQLILLLLLGPLIAQGSQSKIYQWVDERGVTHFSDKPAPGAYELQVDVAPPATYGPITTPRKTWTSTQANKSKTNYKLVVISPSDESTLRDNSGNISITAATDPNPPSGSRYRLIFDNIPQGRLQNSPVFSLTNIPRGAHTIKVQLVDQTGKKIATSKTSTVYMHRAAI